MTNQFSNNTKRAAWNENTPDVSGDSWDYGSTIASANPQFPDNEPNVEGSVSFTATWNRFTYRNYPFFSFEEAHRAVVG